MKWIKDGLSFDETRISALIIAFFITLGFSLYQVVVVGDISDNLLMLLGYELGAFAGVKVAESLTTKTITKTVGDSMTRLTTTSSPNSSELTFSTTEGNMYEDSEIDTSRLP
ncbi:hypothetical protein MKY96_33060 [Paenibacillus sp. FSL R7-0302]|uniref:hypothetical protein n=1 Tax=Paenibacillus sp. FSL R7-0302 TaxID=2921681 RepID=UPI0030FC38B7